MVLYCASGNRSALAAKTLQEELGYENVRVDDRRHHAVEGPRLRRRGAAPADRRAARALLAPPARARDRPRGPAQAARRQGAAAGRRRARLADRALPGRGGRRHARASSTTTWSTCPTSSARSSTRNDRIGVPKVDSAEQAINEINPDVEVVKYQTRLDASNIMEIIEGYDVIVDGVDNFPTRYLLNDATVRLKIPVVSASILGFDGQLSVFAPYEGPVLPLPLPDAAAGRAGAVVRRQRRAGRAARDHGRAAGDRGREARDRRRRAADRPPAALRGARHDVHQPQAPPRPRLPDLLARPGGDLRRGDGRVPGLRSLLRRCGCRLPAS